MQITVRSVNALEASFVVNLNFVKSAFVFRQVPAWMSELKD